MRRFSGKSLIIAAIPSLALAQLASCESPKFEFDPLLADGGASGTAGTGNGSSSSGPAGGAAGACDGCGADRCADGVHNGKETDRDCGGAECQRCAVGRLCQVDDDCISRSCFEGLCALNCMQGRDDCDADADNGCETNLKTDPHHCGGCGDACNLPHATGLCLGGQCAIDQCEEPSADCDGDPNNGCEVNTSKDADNCGECGAACVSVHGTPTCSGAKCSITCDDGFGDCDENPSNGCERDLTRDVNHCGSCERVCEAANGTPWCADGVCGVSDCPPGLGDCNANADDGCEVDLAQDTENCGSCGSLCETANGAAACSDSLCQIETCDPGFADCNAGTPQGLADGCETNVDNDANNCGSCGKGCAIAHATPHCRQGRCEVLTCSPPWANCDDDPSDCEVNTNTNVNHCGGCGENGLACGDVWGGSLHANGECVAGACEFDGCQGSWRNCNGDEIDGCEANIQTSELHCGACGLACEAPFGGNTCQAGACQPACGTQFLDCDGDARTGCEVNPASDRNHCGSCTTVCAANHTTSNPCVNGACSPTCAPGYSDCDNSRANGCEVTGTCPGAVLFSDNFENGTGAWQTNAGGSWALVSDGSNAYAQSETSNNLRMASAGSSNWTDVIAEVRVKVLAFNGTSTSYLAGLCLRRQNEDNLYLIGVRSDGRVGARRRVAGAFNNIGASAANLVTTGIWYTLRAEVVGANLNVYLDDALAFATTDTSHATGAIGLCTVNTSAVFDDVVVRSPL